jgi:hypothetical protein
MEVRRESRSASAYRPPGLPAGPGRVGGLSLGRLSGLSRAGAAGLSPAELRRELVGDRESSMEVIVARAIARGELGPETPPARVISLPVDLLRHELLMTLEPAAPAIITAIVDDVFLPLARVSSGLPDS